jgi:DNA-binding transcriptional LysR family regulator
MDLKYIEIFCTVVELKSFSKAAQALRLTQPTVSIHIKALEDEFSTKLLDRLGRTIQPTQDGEILYRYAREIMNLKERARLAMERVSEAIGGTLTIGASTTPGEYILPQIVSRFRKAYPDVFSILKIADSRNICQLVLDGEVDLGIIGTVIKDKNITTRKFMDDRLMLVAPPDFALSVLNKNEIRKIPLVIREMGSGSRSSIEENLKKIGLLLDDLQIVGEMGSSQALIQAVKSGMGLAFLSNFSVADEIKRGSLKCVRLKGISITRSFHIITHRLRFDKRISTTFVDYLLHAANKEQ